MEQKNKDLLARLERLEAIASGLNQQNNQYAVIPTSCLENF